MIQTLGKIALGATLLTSALTAQQRTQIVPVQTSIPQLAGLEAHVAGSNFNGFSVVGFTAYMSGVPFGSGTIESVDLGLSTTLEYTAFGFTYEVQPNLPWYWWCAGIGTCEFKAG